MNMVPVDSSNLSAVGYDPVSQILRIRFRSGWIYDYYDVPENVYSGLMNAPSKGKYHNACIKNLFQYRRIG